VLLDLKFRTVFFRPPRSFKSFTPIPQERVGKNGFYARPATGFTMISNVERTTENEPTAAIAGVMRVLDYAMIEGAQLKLPLFVLLIQLARRELLEPTCVAQPAGADPRGTRQSPASKGAHSRPRMRRRAVFDGRP
jgi:hypothetical protein